jgi:hypothetical protein
LDGDDGEVFDVRLPLGACRAKCEKTHILKV